MAEDERPRKIDAREEPLESVGCAGAGVRPVELDLAALELAIGPELQASLEGPARVQLDLNGRSTGANGPSGPGCEAFLPGANLEIVATGVGSDAKGSERVGLATLLREPVEQARRIIAPGNALSAEDADLCTRDRLAIEGDESLHRSEVLELRIQLGGDRIPSERAEPDAAQSG